MAPTLCSRCGDAVEEDCDPRDELAELEDLLDRLTRKRYDLKRKVNQLCPILCKLPPDVMSIIFEFCLPYFADNHTFAFSKDDTTIPLSLGAICRYWRDIAWSTPSLWSSLLVCIPTNDSRMAVGLAQEWLERSGQLPLTIRIISMSEGGGAILAVADIVNQYSARWFKLDLSISDYSFHHFQPIDNHAPMLKSIRFYCAGDEMTFNFQQEFQPLTCPCLEKATLSFFPRGIEFDNLTHLTIVSMSIFDSLLILRMTPRLVFCEISGFSQEERDPNPGAIVLPSLRSLRLPIIGFEEDFLNLNSLITPHLEEFRLPTYFDSSMEIITSFVRRSACSLCSLTMIFSTSRPYFDRFMSLLQSMPSLDTLSLLSITTTAWRNTRTIDEDFEPRNILQLVAKVLSSQSTSPDSQQGQQRFLPNLKILEYTGELFLRPGNYSDLYPLPPADNAIRGPFHLLNLNLYPVTRAPKNLISYVSSLKERGVATNVLSKSEDILQSSIDYYWSRKDSSSQEWADNLDPTLLSTLVQRVAVNVSSIWEDDLDLPEGVFP